MTKTLIVTLVGIGTAAALFSVWPSSKVAASTPGTVSYRYDSLGRVVQDMYPANSGWYNYDNAGNRTAASQN